MILEGRKEEGKGKKNTLEGINSRLGEAKDPNSDLEDKVTENIQLEQKKEK